MCKANSNGLLNANHAGTHVDHVTVEVITVNAPHIIKQLSSEALVFFGCSLFQGVMKCTQLCAAADNNFMGFYQTPRGQIQLMRWENLSFKLFCAWEFEICLTLIDGFYESRQRRKMWSGRLKCCKCANHLWVISPLIIFFSIWRHQSPYQSNSPYSALRSRFFTDVEAITACCISF